MPVAVLFVLAIASIGIYGIVLGGWSSGSTYSLLGGLRSSAQMISYEVAMGLALVAVFLYAGSMSTSEIVDAQSDVWYGLHPAAVVRHLRDRDGRRDQPRAVRPPRGRGRARRRLPHRVLLAEVRAVLPRRVHQHGHRLRARDHAVPRWLARPVADQPVGRRQRGLLAVPVVHRQGAASSSSSSSGCAARCRGCATTSSWRSAGSVLIPISLVWIVARRHDPGDHACDGGVRPRVPPRARSASSWSSRSACCSSATRRTRTRPTDEDAEFDAFAGGYPVPPMPATGAVGRPTVRP